ncbi:type I 3-dehydroquinate dehydratase [Motiliproteus sp. MSK22-1]|uniref:type I 3-dehydroquinate dehydratase n=1 Tax=Motiliproteus sp. MSK22-1 TaxID=1897630 RepID=UPI000975BA9A|nr:type I 3-dehydroquinate dehydratase [Motiliproteus sp. MSK22-1]OMH33903.1 3-dehydroquinate dehydratase [Motiliproteus sp. MSK22-1]
MKTEKQIKIKGQAVSKGKQPLVCCPLVASNISDLLEEARAIIVKTPDLIEWRVDFFTDISDTDKVVEAARQIKSVIADIPLLFTRRAEHEGGQRIPLSEDEVVQMYTAVCASRSVDLIDYELSNPADNLDYLRALCQQHQLGLVVSYHNFSCTPSEDDIVQKLLDAEAAGADIAKVAVMPDGLDDVLRLLSATLKANQALQIPLITMSMGAYGSLSRMIGGVFGSAVTFAVGRTSSAPGQMNIDEVNTVLEIVSKQLSE